MISKKLTTKEIADAYIPPVRLSKKEQQAADLELARHRQSRRASSAEKQQLKIKLLQLKFQLEDYIKGEEYNPDLNFGYFLKQYIQLINKKQKDFAEDVDISVLQLSHYLNNRREPNNNFIVRLEIHSNNTISAINWFRLLEKEKEHVLINDKTIRNKERLHVTNTLQVTL